MRSGLFHSKFCSFGCWISRCCWAWVLISINYCRILAVFRCWIWRFLELQVLISINCLRIFGSFLLLNLACFWASSFDFHQLSQNFWQFLVLNLACFWASSFDFHELLQNLGSFWVLNLACFWASSFDFQQLLQNLASSWKLNLPYFKSFSFDFKQLLHEKNSLFLRLTWKRAELHSKLVYSKSNVYMLTFMVILVWFTLISCGDSQEVWARVQNSTPKLLLFFWARVLVIECL